jgi:hypothetical protein
MNGALAEPLFLLVGRLGVFVPFRSRLAQLHFFVGLGGMRPRVAMVRRIGAVVVPGSLFQLTRFQKAFRSSKRCLKCGI